MVVMNLDQDFHLQTLTFKILDGHTLCISPKLERNKQEFYFSKEFLNDYLDVLNKFCANLSIHTIHVSNPENCFYKGIDWTKIHQIQDFLDLSQLLNKIIYISAMMPQVIMMDIGVGAHDIAAEFFLSADIRIIDRTGHLVFDHLLKGISPMGGASILLEEYCGMAVARQWLLTARPIDAQTLQNTGLIIDSYNGKISKNNLTYDLIEKFSSQSSIARIQTKQLLQKNIINVLEEKLNFERSTLRATLFINDWQHYKENKPQNFQNAQMLQTALREKMKGHEI